MPFLQMDCNNYLRSERSKYLETKDAQTLTEYLMNKQAEDPSFFYAMQLNDNDGTIMNIFWLMDKLSWIIMSLKMLFPLTPHFQQINFKCHSLHLLVLIITNRQFFLVQRCYIMKLQIHLRGIQEAIQFVVCVARH